ncbi:MAG: hypothetical protein EPO09_03705, partial [Aquabacterium sp.]|uniref:beta strand repeat-containing protein n=1 Tax=Aquabacterium sp. TaxID=1872578 RepID=UPI001205D26A
MNSAGSIKGSNAGSISLISNSEADLQPKNQAAFRVGDNLSLQGYGIDKGGSLTLRAAAVDLVNNTGTSSSIKNGDTVGSVLIGADLLNRGGFQDYTIEGISRLTVTEGTHLTPGKLSWAATPGLRNLATGSALASVMQSLVQPDASRAATNLTLLATGSKMESGGTLSVARGASITGDPGSKLALKAGGALTVEGDLRSAGGQINLALENRSVKINDTQIATLTVASSATLDVSGQAVYQPSSGPFVLGKVLDGGAISIGPGTNASASSVVLLDADATLRADGSAAELDVARPLGGIGPAYTRQTVASNGGSVTVNMVQGGGTLSNRMSAKGGNSTAGGGAFTLTMANKPVGVVRVQSDAATGGYKAGEVTVSSKALTTGQFADVTLQSPQEINFVNSQDWQLPRSLTLSAPVVSVAANSTVNLKTGGIVLMGRPSQFGNVLSALGDTSKDTGTLTLQSGLVGLFGQQAVKGVKSLDVRASSEVRLMGVSESDDVSNTGNMPGALKTGADVALHAPQVTVASASNYTLDAGKATVTIDGGDKGSLAPLSAGSKLTIKAGTINQNGVLRVPFGSITLDASKINFGDGLTSVSGDGLLVPFGFTTGGGKVLTYLEGKEVTAVTEKSIVVKAGSGDAAVSQNAVLDLSGGGAMVAYEFVPGPGGSNDVFAGALNGAFAVVPTITQYAPTDAAILSDGKLSQASGLGNALALGNTIQFGNNGLVPAGSYAILPARYALLPGAYLVKPSTSVTSAVSLDYSQKQTDGAMIVGAQLGSAGMANSNKPASAFVVMSSQTARRYSEIKSTLVDAYFLDKADTAGTTAQRLAIDAGRLAVDAATASLAGQLKFDHDARAQGGQLDLSSATIHVGANKLEGALNVTYEQLNQSGADSIVLGGLRQSTAADGSTGLTVTAGNVVVDAQAKDLSVADLTLAARNGVKVNDGVRIVAASKAIQADDLVVNGNGALVRVSHDAGANTSRNMVDEAAVGAAGDLTLGKNVVLTGGAVVAEATRTTSLANESSNGVIINASKLTLGAQRMVAGNLPSDAAKPGVGTMVLSDQLLSHFNQAQELSLRSFNGIDLFNGASIGGDGMRSLTIDTGNFRVNGDNAVASLRAGSVQLRNTTGVQAQVPTFAAGQLNVNATGLAGGTGHITVGGGAMAVSGVGEVNLNAAGSVVLAGKSELVSPGDINVSANSLTAANGAQASLTAVGRFKLTAPEAPTGVAPAQPGVGAHVSIQADGIEQRGVITLPSGELNLTAKRTILFAGASRTDLAGLTKAIDGVALDSMGGTLSVKTGVGSITQQTGSVVDVSAGGGAGTAGSMNFSAIKGGVQLSGSLLARSRSG